VLNMVMNLRPLIHDDQTEQTSQVPQCVVIENRGQSVRVYDFQTNQYLNNGNRTTSAGEPLESTEPETLPDADTEETNIPNPE